MDYEYTEEKKHKKLNDQQPEEHWPNTSNLSTV